MARRGYITLTDSGTLIDGVPDYMANSLKLWLDVMLTEPVRPGSSQRRAKADRVRWLERKLKQSLGGNLSSERMYTAITSHMNGSDELKLDIVNALLERYGDSDTDTANILNIVLLESGSKWTARQGTDNIFNLEERVDGAMTDAYEDIVSGDTIAASFLREAWSEAFGRDPSASQAYSAAVKAIEAGVWPKVLADNEKATLGDIIRELERNISKWQTSIEEKTLNLGIGSVISQCKLVWQGQTDRHGTSKPEAPSQSAAEQAVFMAINICQLFERDLVSRE